MKKILITGINGQDGTILSNILIKRKFKVYGITKKKITSKAKDIHLINIQRLNFNKIIKKFDEIKPDVIIHFGSSNPSYNQNFG